MSNNKFIIAIPARLDSKRLPGKVLELIGDKTMLFRVMKNSIDIPNIEDTFLCTDSKLIANEARELPIKVILKTGNFSSGTDRISNSTIEILKNLNLKDNFSLDKLYIINIQADQPFIDKSLIKNFIYNINKMNSPELVTAYFKKEYNFFKDSHDLVKLTTSDLSKKVLYFSRSLIPHINTSKLQKIEKSNNSFIKFHIGVYAYRFDILQSWNGLKTSQLEKYESLEQLRWLDNDIPIYAFEYNKEILSVDNINQLEFARKEHKL
tara:strand:- start:3941 stop:4735 length:795 start_codon:yes stop_codon:yes gene_type:complete